MSPFFSMSQAATVPWLEAGTRWLPVPRIWYRMLPYRKPKIFPIDSHRRKPGFKVDGLECRQEAADIWTKIVFHKQSQM